MLAAKYGSRTEPVEFTFEQNLPTGSGLNKSILRFQQQKMTVTLHTLQLGGSFGFAIVSNQRHTIVEKIVEGYPAWKDGRLRKGDIIQCINNVPIAGLNSNDVVTILKSCGQQAELTVSRFQRLNFPIRFDTNLNQFYHVTLNKQNKSIGSHTILVSSLFTFSNI